MNHRTRLLLQWVGFVLLFLFLGANRSFALKLSSGIVIPTAPAPVPPMPDRLTDSLDSVSTTMLNQCDDCPDSTTWGYDSISMAPQGWSPCTPSPSQCCIMLHFRWREGCNGRHDVELTRFVPRGGGSLGADPCGFLRNLPGIMNSAIMEILRSNKMNWALLPDTCWPNTRVKAATCWSGANGMACPGTACCYGVYHVCRVGNQGIHNLTVLWDSTVTSGSTCDSTHSCISTCTAFNDIQGTHRDPDGMNLSRSSGKDTDSEKWVVVPNVAAVPSVQRPRSNNHNKR